MKLLEASEAEKVAITDQSALASTDALTQKKPWSNPSFSSSSYGGNPLASAAGLAALQLAGAPGFYDSLIRKLKKRSISHPELVRPTEGGLLDFDLGARVVMLGCAASVDRAV